MWEPHLGWGGFFWMVAGIVAAYLQGRLHERRALANQSNEGRS